MPVQQIVDCRTDQTGGCKSPHSGFRGPLSHRRPRRRNHDHGRHPHHASSTYGSETSCVRLLLRPLSRAVAHSPSSPPPIHVVQTNVVFAGVQGPLKPTYSSTQSPLSSSTQHRSSFRLLRFYGRPNVWSHKLLPPNRSPRQSHQIRRISGVTVSKPNHGREVTVASEN